MTIRRGVSLYSYQQSQFLKQLDLEAQIREVGGPLAAEGVEIIDEMSLHYPDPGEEFVARWHGWMAEYGTVPVAMDVGMDVLQFRDHVMTRDEVAARLVHDIRLAKRLSFRIVRVISVTPIEVIERALPVAEELGIRIGKEVHQPMRLEGREVDEVLDLASRRDTPYLGLVPDFGIFQFRLSEAQLGWFARRGAQPDALDASIELALAIRDERPPLDLAAVFRHTAGNLRVDFGRFIGTGNAPAQLRDAFRTVKTWAEARVETPQSIDYTVIAEALLFSNTSPDRLREFAPRITHVHGKFNHMTEIAGRPGEYEDAAIDYQAAVAALQAGGFDGFIDSEYEGQRYWQDLGVEEFQSEIEQVRRHQEMLRRLIGT